MQESPSSKASRPYPNDWPVVVPLQIRPYRLALYYFTATGLLTLVVAVAFEFWLRAASMWPGSDAFTFFYRLVAFEYSLVTVVISALVHSRHWAERLRREEASHYRTLLLLLLVRDVVHFWLLTWASDPLSLWLALTLAGCCLAGSLVLPVALAHRYVAVVLAGYAALSLTAAFADTPAWHPLAPVFAQAPSTVAPWMIAFAGAPLFISLMLGWTVTGKWQGLSPCFDPLRGSDPTTRMPMRDRFMEQLEEELERTRHEIDPLSVVIVEAAGLTKFGVRSGDTAVRKMLRTVSAAITRSIRTEEDTVARLSWSRFGVILPEAGSVHAHSVADRIRKKIQRFQAVEDPFAKLAFRIGVASAAWPAGVSAGGLFNAALHSLQQNEPDARIPISHVLVGELDLEVPCELASHALLQGGAG